jgi:ElaB/YqjD/DUF883 family membrane-anchored ribosome-binding protein
MSSPGIPGEGSASSEQMRNKAQQVGQNLREMGQMAGEAARERLEQARQTATEFYQTSKEKAQEWEQNIEEYVRAHPVQSVLIAAGTGLLLGMLLRRRD